MIVVQAWVKGGHSEDAFCETADTIDHPNATAIAEPMTTNVSNEAMMMFRVLSRMVSSIMTISRRNCVGSRRHPSLNRFDVHSAWLPVRVMQVIRRALTRTTNNERNELTFA
jgi:hypothetical protein